MGAEADKLGSCDKHPAYCEDWISDYTGVITKKNHIESCASIMDFRIDFYYLHQDFEDTQRYTSAFQTSPLLRAFPNTPNVSV